MALALALPLCEAQQPAKTAVFFPLANHSWWDYSGTVKIAGNPDSKKIQLRMEIIDVVERGGVRAAWVRGTPLSLIDHAQGSGDQVLARIGTKIYLTSTAKSAAVRKRMEDTSDELKTLFTDSELLMDTALPVGPGATMQDGDYQITRGAKNDFRTIRFRPGVGIVEFRYADSGETGYLKLDTCDVQPEISGNATQ
jgi:hypothetical protein